VEFESFGWVENEQEWKFGPNGALPVLPALEHFSVSGLISEELVVAFLERCPRMKLLKVHGDRAWPTLPTRLSSAVRNRSATLRGLCFDVPFITDETISLFLEGWRWQHLSLSPSGTIGDLSRAILLSGASTMESLVVEGVRGFGGEFLKDFFVAAKNLRTFSGLTFSRPTIHEFDLAMDVQHVQHKPAYSALVVAEKVQEEKRAGEMERPRKTRSLQALRLAPHQWCP